MHIDLRRHPESVDGPLDVCRAVAVAVALALLLVIPVGDLLLPLPLLVLAVALLVVIPKGNLHLPFCQKGAPEWAS